jgi:hypothetical protein
MNVCPKRDRCNPLIYPGLLDQKLYQTAYIFQPFRFRQNRAELAAQLKRPPKRHALLDSVDRETGGHPVRRRISLIYRRDSPNSSRTM